ncbi:MAG: flagellar biosynthetic protein FliO [Betaproteobacteria bacterium]|nr:flagellar biosynthetic protein FliO [Betaproteobacteria bacterium]
MNLMKEAAVRLPIGFVFLLSFPVAAQTAAPTLVVSASPVSMFGGLQVLFSLGIVLAVIVGVAWLLKRFTPGQMGAGGVVKVIGGVALGPKERLVLVEVGETWLVLGVAPGQVNALHTLAKPEGGVHVTEVPSGSEHGFSVWLKKAMQGRKSEQ